MGSGFEVITKQRTIAAFDFDGTITTRDTFVPFLFRCNGFWRTAFSFISHLPTALRVGIRLESRDKLKALMIKDALSGRSRDELENYGLAHAQHVLGLCRPRAMERIAWHKEQGHELVMVSASLDIYLHFVAQKLGFNALLCTEVLYDSSDNCLGRFESNCRRGVKVDKLRSRYGDLGQYCLYGYGDTVGDQEMLAVSNHSFFRPFH